MYHDLNLLTRPYQLIIKKCPVIHVQKLKHLFLQHLDVSNVSNQLCGFLIKHSFIDIQTKILLSFVVCVFVGLVSPETSMAPSVTGIPSSSLALLASIFITLQSSVEGMFKPTTFGVSIQLYSLYINNIVEQTETTRRTDHVAI